MTERVTFYFPGILEMSDLAIWLQFVPTPIFCIVAVMLQRQAPRAATTAILLTIAFMLPGAFLATRLFDYPGHPFSVFLALVFGLPAGGILAVAIAYVSHRAAPIAGTPLEADPPQAHSTGLAALSALWWIIIPLYVTCADGSIDTLRSRSAKSHFELMLFPLLIICPLLIFGVVHDVRILRAEESSGLDRFVHGARAAVALIATAVIVSSYIRVMLKPA